MTQGIGVLFSAPAATTDTADTTPLAASRLLRGSLHTANSAGAQYANLAALIADTPASRREPGMLGITADGFWYKLAADLTTWVDVTPSNNSSQSSYAVLDPTIPTRTQQSINDYFPTTADVGCIRDNTADTTVALQKFFSRMATALFYVNQNWTGYSDNGAVNPVGIVLPGTYQLSGTMVMSTGSSMNGAGAGADTNGIIRFLMNSTGTSPGQTWLANYTYTGQTQCVPTASNGYYYTSNGAGKTGSVQPTWPTTVGQTVADGTLVWTCTAATAAGDNRNKPLVKFSRVVPGTSVIENGFCTVAIVDMEFWYTTMGNNVQNPLSGAGIPFKGYPQGGSIYIDVPMIDSKIERVCFQHSPCAIRIVNVSSAYTTFGDGQGAPGGVVVNLKVKNCEFDNAAIHIWATNSALDLDLSEIKFSAGQCIFENCTGTVLFSNGKWESGAFIDAITIPNNFALMTVKGTAVGVGSPIVSLSGCTDTDVDLVVSGPTGSSGMLFVGCGGRVRGSIQNSGYNSSPETSFDTAIAAVKAIGCNLDIDVAITTPNTAGAYNGFGVLTGNGSDSTIYSTAGNSACRVKSVVQASYNAATYRSQPRGINLAAGDLFLGSYQSNRGVIKFSYGFDSPGTALIQAGQLYGATTTLDLNTAIADSGIYEVYVQTQPISNLATMNFAKFTMCKRAAGGVVVLAGMSSSGSVQGVISLTGTVITLAYATEAFYGHVVFQKFGNNGVE